MFGFEAKFDLNEGEKLDKSGIVQAVIMLREKSGPTQNKAARNLVHSFVGLIKNKYKSIRSGLNADYDEIIEQICSQFIEILLGVRKEDQAHHLKLVDSTGKDFGRQEISKIKELEKKNDLSDDEKKELERLKKEEEFVAHNIIGYISSAFNTKINIHSIRELLGEQKNVSPNRETELKNALAKYKKEHGKMPDFNSEEDVKILAKMMNKKEETVKEMIKLLGGSEKSLSQDIAGGEDDEKAIALMDTLQSNLPIPSEVLDDKNLLQMLRDDIQNSLTPEQRRVLMFTYPDLFIKLKMMSEEDRKKLEKIDKDRPTTEQIAELTGYTPRMTRHWVATGKEELAKNPKLMEMYNTSSLVKIIKKAIREIFATTEDLIFEIVKTSNC